MKLSRRVTALLTIGVLLAGCANGKSILDAGNRPGPPTTVPLPATVPGQTTVPGRTTIAPTTTASPLDELPDCPTHALDSASSPVQITVWHAMGGGTLGPAIEQLTDDYNKSQPKVRVNLVDQSSYEANIAKYLDAGQEARPDVVQLPEYMMQSIVDLKATVPVGKCVIDSGYDTSAFIPGAIRAYSTGGVQWSMPFNISDPVLFYNKKMFAAAGLDPDNPPLTLDDVRADSQKIVDSGAAKFGLALDVGFDSGGGWYLEQFFAKLGHFYVDNDNGRRARATRVLYNDATGADLLGQMKSLIDSGLAVNVGDNASGFDDLLKMADNTAPAAMTIHTSAALGSVLEILRGGQFPNIGADDVGVGPMPRAPHGRCAAAEQVVGGDGLCRRAHRRRGTRPAEDQAHRPAVRRGRRRAGRRARRADVCRPGRRTSARGAPGHRPGGRQDLRRRGRHRHAGRGGGGGEQGDRRLQRPQPRLTAVAAVAHALRSGPLAALPSAPPAHLAAR